MAAPLCDIKKAVKGSKIPIFLLTHAHRMGQVWQNLQDFKTASNYSANLGLH